MKLFTEAWFLVKMLAQIGWSVMTAPKFVPMYSEAEIRPLPHATKYPGAPLTGLTPIQPKDMICCGATMQYDGSRQKYWCGRCGR